MPNKPRVISGTVSDGRVTFNQSTLVRARQPEELAFVAIDHEAGVYAWRTTPAKVKAAEHEQHHGYSRQIGPVDPKNPPPFLGRTSFTPKKQIPAVLWHRLRTARTNGLKKAAEEFLGV
jgi:hypothetical protein